MQNQQRIGVLHYHLLPCGVRTVITNALRALIAYGGYDYLKIDLISSDARREPGDKLAEELLDWARRKGPGQFRLNQVEISELAYNHQAAPDRESLFDQAQHISNCLLEVMELGLSDLENPYILHVHNSNLGKNPYLTLALKILADQLSRENLPAWILYQMHDFAESNRPDCWKALRDCSGQTDPDLAVEMMYPGDDNGRVQWVCINSGDKQALLTMGIDPDFVTVLPNCIAVDTFTAEPLTAKSSQQIQQMYLDPIDFGADLKDRIAGFSDENGFYFDRSRKILLAPIKAIRRKNVAESILLMMALNARQDCYQLLVTLPANSRDDIVYCHKIERFVRHNRLPVVIGFGRELLESGDQRTIKNNKLVSYSMVDLLAISEAVVTTSIQEGFGYVFHEPWLAGKLVFGRNIAAVTCDFVAQGLNLNHLYDHLLIPLDWLDQQGELMCRAYCRKVAKLYQTLGMNPPSDAEIHDLFQQKKVYTIAQGVSDPKKMIDWADLDVDTQLYILQRLTRESGLIDRLVWTNNELEPIFDWFPIEKAVTIQHNGEVVSSRYNLENQACQLVRLFREGGSRLGSAGGGVPGKTITNSSVFENSLKLENLHLLA